jgi:hypothetical protein
MPPPPLILGSYGSDNPTMAHDIFEAIRRATEYAELPPGMPAAHYNVEAHDRAEPPFTTAAITSQAHEIVTGRRTASQSTLTLKAYHFDDCTARDYLIATAKAIMARPLIFSNGVARSNNTSGDPTVTRIRSRYANGVDLYEATVRLDLRVIRTKTWTA